MTQQTSPFIEGKYGWSFGESGWNSGMDENLLKFSFMFDRNIDGIVDTLPSAATSTGKAYYLNSDKRLYFGVNTNWYSTPIPKWFTFIIRSTGVTWQFDGNVISEIANNKKLSQDIVAIEATLSQLGTASQKNTEFFASSTQLASQATTLQTYTDTKTTQVKTDLAAGSGSGLVGYKLFTSSSTARTSASAHQDRPCVFDYFTNNTDINDVRNGTKLHDHTSYVQAFINDMKGFTSPQFRNGLFPAGDYNITQVVFTDHNDVGIEMAGARFNWIGTTSTTGMIKLVNAINFAIYGHWVVNGYDSLLLTDAVWSTTGPGDGITVPLVGVSSNVLLDGLTGYRCKNALRFGTYNADPSIAETIVTRFRSQLCPGAISIAGSQTGVQISNSVIVSQPGNFATGSAEESAIKMEGGFATVSGSIVEHVSTNTGQLIHLSPCQSSTYGNVFPTLVFGGASHIESAAYIALIDNPRGLPSPDSSQACLDLMGITGYIGAIPASQNLIVVDTPNFSGSIKTEGGNLYAGATVRTAANIAFTDSAPNAKVEVANNTFGKGCLPWLGGVLNGKVIHPMTPSISASNLNNQSIAASGSGVLKWTVNKTTANYARYGADYSTATGVYTVHSGGVSALRIKVNTLINTTGSGYVEILKNNSRVFIKTISTTDLSINLEFEDTDVVSSTTYQVKITNTGATPIGFGATTSDTITVSTATN